MFMFFFLYCRIFKMASEILSNLQLGSLIFNATKINPLSATSGAFISAPSVTVTDSATAASGTLTQFNAHYLAAPTLAATNTGVTTTLANTLTIGGAPTAGTNETLTNAYALNVLSGSTNLAGTLYSATALEANSCYSTWISNGISAGTTSTNTVPASSWTLVPQCSRVPSSFGGMSSSGYVTAPYRAEASVTFSLFAPSSMSTLQIWVIYVTSSSSNAANGARLGAQNFASMNGSNTYTASDTILCQAGDTFAAQWYPGTAVACASSSYPYLTRFSIKFKPV